ncbi:MAG TPA: NapC/NirT family cytochrome c [Thioalkalivibrio sp.]|nr:NapC/NirT family cytochrome c [Thioalkalivibrio sp.]
MKRLVTVIVIVLVLGLLVWGGTASHQVTTTDAFCSSCHAYEKASWDHGPHPEVGCLDCHTGGFVRDKTQGVRKVWLVLTGEMDPHHDVLASYPEKTFVNCVNCHMGEEVQEENPIFMERHSRYMVAAEYCIGCHEGGHVQEIRNMRYLAVRRGADVD